MTEQTPPAPPSLLRAFLPGAGQGFTLAFLVLGMFISIAVGQQPERLPWALQWAVVFGLASTISGGIRTAWLSRHRRWAPRLAIGALCGAAIGASIGGGIVVCLATHDSSPPPLMIAWCALCFGLILGLRTLSHHD